MSGEQLTKRRESWVDVAKGIAIILVVLLHATMEQAEGLPRWRWDYYSLALETFRLPLFFFCAGLFAAGALRKDFRGLVDSRLLRLIWLYVLWGALAVVVSQFIPFIGGTGENIFVALALLPVRPSEATWFIYAIVVYFVLAWCIRRLPVAVQLIIAFVITMLFRLEVIDFGNGEWTKVGSYFFFYFIAVVGSARLRAFVPRLRWWQLLLVPLAYLGVVYIERRLGWSMDAATWLGLSLMSIAAGCAVAVLLSRTPWFGWLSWLGSRTLPVYLLHWYFLALGAWIIVSVSEAAQVVAPIVIPALAAFAIGGSLTVYRVVGRVPGLFDRPRWLTLSRSVTRRSSGR